MTDIQANPRIRKKIFSIVVLILLVACAITIRYFFRSFQSLDYVDYNSKWIDYIHKNGFLAFRDNFANYNLPYLYLLFLCDRIGLHGLVAVKVIPIFFDFILASSVFLVVQTYKKENIFIPLFASVITLLLPTVFFNSSYWGQCDSIYTSFLVFSFYGIRTRKPLLIWFAWSVAFTFKLQSVFFLPFLLLDWLLHRKEKWFYPLVFIPVFFFPLIPALIAGRPFSSLISIYFSQFQSESKLSASAPNFFQWFNNNTFDYFQISGIFIALVVVLLVCYGLYAKYYVTIDQKSLVLGATLILLVVPFFLPAMHERYFYPAEIFSLLIAFIYTDLVWIVALTQLIGVFSYAPFLFGLEPPVRLSVLAIFMLSLIVILCMILFHNKSAVDH